MQADEVFRLSEVTRYVQQVLTINFEQSFWLEAEVNQVGESRGNYYIDLVEKDPDSDQLLAMLPARIWRSNQVLIKRKINGDIKEYLQAGVKVKLRGSIKFHAVYGISFQVDDIDPDFTMGEIERRKLETMKRLTRDGVFEVNKALPIPPVIQRIAVISSRTAAGLADFINQLEHNQHNIPFSIDLYHATVQGANAPREIIHALDEITEFEYYYDAVCIVRGGGSKLDLSAFDDESLCRRIADMPLPVISGIGHETDTSIVDLTVHTYLKTPTALAAFLIDKNSAFLSFLYEEYQRAISNAQYQIKTLQQKLFSIQRKAELNASQIVRMEKLHLDRLAQQAEFSARRKQRTVAQDLQLLKVKAESVDPSYVLRRGFALVSQDSTIKKSITELNPDKEVTILFHDGKTNLN